MYVVQDLEIQNRQKYVHVFPSESKWHLSVLSIEA